MLIFTSRESESRAESVLKPNLDAGSARQALATLERTPEAMAAHWQVSQTDGDVDDDDAMQSLLPLFQRSGPLLVYLHGYHGTPAACFERCDRLQSLYGLEVVRFSWSSIKHLSDGSQQYLQSNAYPRPLCSMAGALDEGLTCSWWLVMALTGNPLDQGP